MKIDKILFISNDNPNYLSFWESISRHYLLRLDITPKLFFIGEVTNENKKFLNDKYGEIEVVKPLENLPIIIQALWGKFWLTQTELETNWLIGDIDLYLLNKNYLSRCLNQCDDEDYVHINANGYRAGNWFDVPHLGLPGYFHAAKGKTFKKMLGLSDSFYDDVNYIFSSKKYGAYFKGIEIPERVKKAIPDGYNYICSEEHLTTERLIPQKNSIKCFTYDDSLKRIENLDHFSRHEMSSYIDIHCPRPYPQYSEKLEKILNNYD